MATETTEQPAPDAATSAKKSMTSASASPSAAIKRCGSVITASGLGEYHQKIIEKRGLNREIAENLGWRTSKDRSDVWLEIPYFSNGKEVNCKYRKFGKGKAFRQNKDAEKVLYNVDVIKDLGSSPLVICEGEMDCLVALQCGFKAVSVPDGAPAQKVADPLAEKYSYLSAIPGDCTVILATDNDEPGHNLLHDLQVRLGAHRCKWVKYPEGCKDLNDVVYRLGEAAVVDTLNSAPYVQVDGIYRMSELPPAPYHPALGNGISGLDDKFRFRKGDFSVLTGYANAGKSTLAAELMANMIDNHHWKIAVASFETNPTVDHKNILRTLHCRKPVKEMEIPDKQKADKWIDDNFIFIVPGDYLCIDDQADADLKWILSRCAAAVMRFGLDMVIIDPWNEIDHTIPPNMSLTQYTGFAIKQFKRFARKYQVHVMVIAHPAKPLQAKGKAPTPSLYAISDSAHWANKADLGLVVMRGDDQKTKLSVAKSRYYNILGYRGDYELEYDEHTGRFTRFVY